MFYGRKTIMSNNRGSEWNRWDLHLHTASSYDYKYKADDADELLCKALKANEIKAVAITDHFIIDKCRIENLRSIAPEIVFFPGVELRTDKGANNLHLILIFPDESDLSTLSADFDAIMLRQKAKSKDSNETIYWEFGDIVEFANDHNGLISIHAGRKTNGIEKEIGHALPVKDAIKSDIADKIHFFEVGQKRDISDYEQFVFKEIERKPLIMCSDSHSPNEYSPKEALWIKAELTFSGLKQCLYQPQERVFIGEIPPALDRTNKNKQSNISSISCFRIESPINDDSEWFKFELPLNPSMVAIIGNKGSGKSAFSDIIGHLCNCSTMESASFLNAKRFRKAPKNYADDYEAALIWLDGKKDVKKLTVSQNSSSIENAQYLPQKYIEDVCNDFGDVFQKEIDKVIFSYVDKSERGDAQNLDDLIRIKSKPLEIQFQDERIKLQEINEKIIKLEAKKTNEYHKKIEEHLKKAEEILERHDQSKPKEVTKSDQQESDTKYKEKLEKLNQEIQEKKDLIKIATDKIAEINSLINDIKILIAKISLLQTQFGEVKDTISDLINKYKLNETDFVFELTTPQAILEELIIKSEKEKEEIQASISDEQKGFSSQLKKAETEKEKLISSANVEEKIYQKYLSDLSEWNDKRLSIIGDKDTEESIEYYKNELDYISTKLESEYRALIEERYSIAKRLYNGITKLSKIYQSIYTPIQGEIAKLLGDLEDGVMFHAEVFMKDHNLSQNILNYINQRYNGKYGRSHNSLQEIEARIKETDFGNEDSVISFVCDMENVITSELESAENRVPKRQDFYDFIFGLTYIGVNFKLKMGNRSLEELSPGERGIVLLIFYLALSKENKPIIIDQPEDNLDNQSVYSKLVPCICRAKQKRQVIIVTHNPNIAVACDAEQIVFCEKNSDSNEIRYKSGAIENPIIRKHVVDVLEGTMPAFDLRRLKYD